MSLKIGLVSHQRLLRDLLGEHLTKHCGVATSVGHSTGAELIAAGVGELDLLIVDCDLPDCCPFALMAGLQQRSPALRVALLADSLGGYSVHRLLEMKLAGLLHKRDPLSLLPSALNAMLAGGIFISPQVAAVDKAIFQNILSARELDILRLSASGSEVSAIARQLRLAPTTVQTHRRNGMQKIGVRSQADLVRFALRHGFLSVLATTGKR